MKKRLLIFTILASIISTVNISQASANCSSDNPCGTWAVLDAQGVVSNVIVCQASVCGGGTWAGQTVVPQVAPNPTTNDTTGQGSFMGNKENGSTVTYSNGVFTINEPGAINRSETLSIDNKVVETEVFIPILSKTFTYEDTVGKNYNNIPFIINEINPDSNTNISVKETNKNTELVEKQITKEIFSYDENGNLITNYIQETIFEEEIIYDAKKEQLNFIHQITKNQFQDEVVMSNLNLLNSKIDTFFRLLSDWFVK